MAFLLPVLRQTVRSNLRNTTNLIRQQNIQRIPHTIPITSTYIRAYSQNNDKKPSAENTSQHEQSDPSNAAKEPLEDPLAPESSISPDSKNIKDPFSGDIQPTAGGILSQFTSTPTEVAQLESESSGSPAKKEEYVSSADRKRETMARVTSWSFLALVLAGAVYLGRPLDEEERERLGWGEVPDGWGPGSCWKRFQKRGKNMLAFFNEPAFEKLLPPPAPEPYGRPYTLLLDLDDLLIHSEWTREHGWRTAKRPGLDYFLGYLSQYYEIVIFTNQYTSFAAPVVGKLDPYHNSLSGALFRESTRYVDGKVVKDLSYLNRDLSKVILVDTNPDSCMLQPENCILMDKWKGTIDDNGLVALIPFLEYLASQNFQDFRPILKEYKEDAGKRHVTIADEFARREALAREALQKTLKPAQQATSSPTFISRLFGIRTLPPVQMPATAQQGEIVTPLDLQRQMAKENYEAMKKYIDEHGEEILEEDKKREQQMLTEQKMSLMGFFERFGSGGAPPPPPSSQDGKK